jgi:gluconolactonase
VSDGYTLAETPLWVPCDHRLLFADVMGGGGTGVIHALAADGTVSVFMSGTGNAAGLAFDIDGSLILAQMGGKPGHVARRDASGTLHQLDPPGAMLHTPDDVVVRSDGTIYFSDGDYCPVGTKTGYYAKLPVYVIRPGSTELVNGGTVSGPNGLELSPDEQTLYVNGYGEGAIWPFHVAADGSLTKPDKALVTGLTNPDGVCLDVAGNLYVAVNTGLDVLRPDGSKVKHLPIANTKSSCSSTSGTTNCAFGGEDGKTLYVTNWTTLYAVQSMPIPGLEWLVNRERLKCR